MGGFFSKKKTERVTEQDKAVLKLKIQRDKLKQYQKKISSNLEKEKEVAKQLLKDKRIEKAKLLLKKKHYQENLLQKTDDQLINIDKLIHDVEFAQIEAKVIDGLKAGNEALKKIHEVMTLEDVEKLMEDTKEAVAYQNEIDALISGALTEQDEEDILAELDALTQSEDLPSVPDHEIFSEDQLPDVPTQEPTVEKQSTKSERIAVEAT